MEHTSSFPSDRIQAYLKDLCDVSKECYQRGWCYGTAGNFSFKDDSFALSFWVSPTGVSKESLNPSDFLKWDPLLSEQEKTKASLEFPFHLAIYHKHHHAQTVVHAHPPHAVAASFCREQLIFRGHEMAKALGARDPFEELKVKVHPNLSPKDFSKLSSNSFDWDGCPYIVLVQGHGVFAWGETPKEALGRIQALEFMCQVELVRGLAAYGDHRFGPYALPRSFGDSTPAS